MILTERIEVSDEVVASGGSADIRTGRYMEHLVAVKTIRFSEQDDIRKVRKVSMRVLLPYLRRHLNYSPPAIL